MLNKVMRRNIKSNTIQLTTVSASISYVEYVFADFLYLFITSKVEAYHKISAGDCQIWLSRCVFKGDKTDKLSDPDCTVRTLCRCTRVPIQSRNT